MRSALTTILVALTLSQGALYVAPVYGADSDSPSSRKRLLDARNSWILTSPPSKILLSVYTKEAKLAKKKGDTEAAASLSEAALEHVRHLHPKHKTKMETVQMVQDHHEAHDLDTHEETLTKVASTPYVRSKTDYSKKKAPVNFKKQSTYLDMIREADLLASEGERKQAEKMYVEALDHLSQLRSTNGMLLVRLVDRVTRMFYRDGKYLAAEEIIRKHLYRHDSMFERLGPQDNDRLQIAFLLSDLGLVYSGMNKFYEAEAVTKEALHLVKRFHGEKNADYIVMLGALARLHKYMGKLNQSQREYKKAISLANDNKNISKSSKAVILGNYYKLLTKMGKTRLASKIADQANSLRPGTVKHQKFETAKK